MRDDGVAAMLEVLNAGFPKVETMTGPEARAVVASRRQPVTNIDDVASAEDRLAGTVPVRVYHPHRPAGGAVVFAHGGGFVFCDLDTHDGFCRAMARHTDAVVVSVDYRLAPEHRAPAAAEDVCAAYAWTTANAAELGIDPERVVLAGDSVGGTLSAATALWSRDHDVPAPRAQVLLYPATEPSFDTESYRTRATGCFNTRAAMEWYWSQYLGDAAPGPLSAPARATSHADLPRAIILTCGLDPLHSEGVAYAALLREAAVPVLHRDYPGLFHGFLTMMSFPPAVAAREILWADLREVLA